MSVTASPVVHGATVDDQTRCIHYRTELTVDAYRATDDCPACGAEFNPGCRLHSHLFFEG